MNEAYSCDFSDMKIDLAIYTVMAETSVYEMMWVLFAII
jgi:hypothetical protein